MQSKTAELHVSGLSAEKQRILIHGALGGVKRFFSSPENWAAYEAWHMERYGRPPDGGFGCPQNH